MRARLDHHRGPRLAIDAKQLADLHSSLLADEKDAAIRQERLPGGGLERKELGEFQPVNVRHGHIFLGWPCFVTFLEGPAACRGAERIV